MLEVSVTAEGAVARAGARAGSGTKDKNPPVCIFL